MPTRRTSLVLLSFFLLLGCGADAPAPATDRPLSKEDAAVGASDLGEGFVVWESNRTGDWRIWTRRLDGSGLAQLSPDENGRQHCCPHISPDGRRIVYLSRDVVEDRYPKREVAGDLRLVEPDGSGERTLVQARTYGWGNRAAVWRDDSELVYVDAEGRTRLLDLASGESRVLVSEAREELGWLLDPTLSHATNAAPSFSIYDTERRAVAERRIMGGCEPYFSHDGRWGFWVAGAGGPIYRMDLESREVSIVLRKNDPRLEGRKGYLYFPMPSKNGYFFAYGASADEHDHFRSDYDVYVARSDPRNFELAGDPVRMTSHPGSDRYPDVFAEPLEPERHLVEVAPPAPAPLEEEGWPVDREGLVFLWQTGDKANLVPDRESGLDESFTPEPRGLARLDHDYAMVLDGGSFRAPAPAAAKLLAAVERTNEFTLEATLRASGETSRPADVLAFAGRGRRNLALVQEGRDLVLDVLAGRVGAGDGRYSVRLFEIVPGERVRLALTYAPGRLGIYRDGERVGASDEVQSGFFRWKEGELTFGGGWSGVLEGIAILDRALDSATLAASHRRYSEILDRRPEVPRFVVRARLTAKSRIPTLREISPYDRALAVYEYEVEEVLEGDVPARKLRVAHWAVLDGKTLPLARAEPGTSTRLVLEPFGDNPQIESLYLSDSLEEDSDLELYYDVGT